MPSFPFDLVKNSSWPLVCLLSSLLLALFANWAGLRSKQLWAARQRNTFWESREATFLKDVLNRMAFFRLDYLEKVFSWIVFFGLWSYLRSLLTCFCMFFLHVFRRFSILMTCKGGKYKLHDGGTQFLKVTRLPHNRQSFVRNNGLPSQFKVLTCALLSKAVDLFFVKFPHLSSHCFSIPLSNIIVKYELQGRETHFAKVA